MAAEVQAFVADFAIPPGETLEETLESLGLSQSDLAERTGRPKKTINEIVRGKAAITAETALQFERVLGVPADFWLSLEAKYRVNLARLEETHRLDQQLQWLDEIPIQALIRAGWVQAKSTAREQLSAALSFFGVASVQSWRNIWGDVENAVAFRHSPSWASDFGTVVAWLRRGELEARSVECNAFDAGAFRETLKVARSWTRDDPNEFRAKLLRECSKAGVVVLFVPELPAMRVCGVTRWLGPEKALIQVTLRYRTEDHLWFTLFHEAGHILLHQKRAVFVEEAAQTRNAISPSARSVEEEQANKFARDLLIPPNAYSELVRSRDFSQANLTRFATGIGITPGIVVARLQHDGILVWQTSLNRLKRRYRWAAQQK